MAKGSRAAAVALAIAAMALPGCRALDAIGAQQPHPPGGRSSEQTPRASQGSLGDDRPVRDEAATALGLLADYRSGAGGHRVALEQPMAGYSKATGFPTWERVADAPGWYGANPSCDVRKATLWEEARDKRWVDYAHCRMEGTWVDPYGRDSRSNVLSTRDSRRLDIDHVVPTANAWASGAQSWSQSRRAEFANDHDNTVAAGASTNRSKGDKTADEWLPNGDQLCSYVYDYTRVKHRYNLTMTAPELARLESEARRCAS